MVFGSRWVGGRRREEGRCSIRDTCVVWYRVERTAWVSVQWPRVLSCRYRDVMWVSGTRLSRVGEGIGGLEGECIVVMAVGRWTVLKLSLSCRERSSRRIHSLLKGS